MLCMKRKQQVKLSERSHAIFQENGSSVVLDGDSGEIMRLQIRAKHAQTTHESEHLSDHRVPFRDNTPLPNVSHGHGIRGL